MKPWLFWLLWTLDAVVALVFVYFFLAGIGDHTVSSFNIVLWLGILAFLAAVLGGSWVLRRKGHGILAYCVLALVAVPALSGAALFAIVVLSGERMN